MICGIDIGSRSVKIVLLADNTIYQTKIVETVDFYRTYGNRQGGQIKVDFAALGMTDITGVVATGYGRNTLDLEGALIIPELKAHVIGACWQVGLADYTLLDLGGQDSKVIKVRQGKMVDFQTNDKCAASTGRYLENMATVLGLSLEELGGYYEDPVQLSATCAIFGESELISRIVEGYTSAQLAAGVNYSIFKRIKPMLGALASDTVVFTGGVALGDGLKKIIEQQLGVKVVVPPLPQLNGAIGCAVYSREMRG